MLCYIVANIVQQVNKHLQKLLLFVNCCLQQLWSLVVENADFLSQLRTMKEFFLLGRGELFLAFIDKANSMLCVPPSSTTKHGRSIILQQFGSVHLYFSVEMNHYKQQ